ncbi:PiggyBac transposable element-derived protein 2 [Anthophora plagiata]
MILSSSSEENNNDTYDWEESDSFRISDKYTTTLEFLEADSEESDEETERQQVTRRSSMICQYTEDEEFLHENVNCDDPFSLYQLFLSDNLLELIVNETNRYAEQSNVGVENSSSSTTRKHQQSWMPVTIGEIKKFTVILIIMGLVRLPEIKLYWSKNTMYSNARIKEVMRRDRFLTVLKYLHFSNNETAIIARRKARRGFTEKKPDVGNLHIFGCDAHVHKEQRKKLDNKTEKHVFVGYSEESKAYRLLARDTNKIKISRDVAFLDKTNKSIDTTSNEVTFPIKINHGEDDQESLEGEEFAEESSEKHSSEDFFEADVFEAPATEERVQCRRSEKTNRGVPPDRRHSDRCMDYQYCPTEQMTADMLTKPLVQINPDKTEVIVFNKKRKDSKIFTPITLYNKKTTTLNSVKYLGVHLDSKLTHRSHIKQSTRKVHAKSFLSHKRLFYSKDLDKCVQILCYKLLIRPILTYGCPIWYNISAGTLEKLRIFERKSLHST